ncbi:hypothetical protein TSUD_59130 [Trifolium subterraneum]|uniref:ATP-dependent DNA helicase n=1 Tax=Trifolium subterraneum TaxID=3900 RepID=A0A2Z6M9Q2_TRISU|nr:hypothetical protein TSUD_59130 [Trifolium subterraneum]
MALTVGNLNQFSNIDEINSDRATWNFRAKITRLWKVSDFNRTNVPFSIEMVLMDSLGGIGFMQIVRSPFNFVPISEVVGGSYDTDFLVDVIGFLTSVGQEREITNQNGTSTKLNVIALEVNGHKLQCTLFGQYVDELNTFIGAVIDMQCVDKIHIQNCMNCSILIFNPTCLESVNLRASLTDAIETLSPLPLTQLNAEARVQPVDEFLYNTPRITLQGLKDATSESLNVVVATVKRILNSDSYYYIACMCSKAVIPDSRMFYCEKCNKHVQKVVPRVVNHTDSVTLVIFDKEASFVFNMSCANIIQGAEPAVGVGIVPPQIEDLVDKIWLFKVEAKPSACLPSLLRVVIIGSLLPEAGTTPKFAQLYIFDTENEVENRDACFKSNNKKKDAIDKSLVKDLKEMIDCCNQLAKSFRKVKDAIQAVDEVAGLIVGDFEDSKIGIDVIVNDSRFGFTRIHETHVLFPPLQYPLMFSWGENGWEPNIPHRKTKEALNEMEERVKIRDFMAFRIQERKMEFGNIVFSKRLFQQFMVDFYIMIEVQRLSFIRENQDKIRCDVLGGLQEVVDMGDVDASLVGKRIILLDTFTGGPRYMFNNSQDAMGICPDRSNVDISNKKQAGEPIDEIKRFYDCRYLSPADAVWRTFAVDIHQKFPAVIRLFIHLGGQQVVKFDGSSSLHNVVYFRELVDTMFLAWFSANKEYEEGRNLVYSEFLKKFVYIAKDHRWQPRQKGFSIGRLTYVPVGSGELYYLRVLLTKQRGCTSYESIKMVDGKICKTFQEASNELRLLKDDQEFKDAIKEAYEIASGDQKRRLFVRLLNMNTMSNAFDVWNCTWKLLCDGILYNRRRALNLPGALHSSLVQKLTEEQHVVYEEIMTSVLSGYGQFFFLYGHGGTGKIFLWRTLSAGLRAQGKIVINVASNGIAYLLLPNGKTAHSTFCIPLEINEKSTCNITQDCHRAQLLRSFSLFLWDEAPMMNRYFFEAFDHSMKDLMGKVDKANRNKPFGGKVVVLGGDFRQILPLTRKGSRGDVVKATISSSKLWKHCKVLQLTKNMRLKGGDENGEVVIKIAEELCVLQHNNPLLSLVDFVYPNIVNCLGKTNFFEDEAILAPTLEVVQEVNDFLLSMIPGESRDFLSCDTPCKSDEDHSVQNEWFTSDFLNDIQCSGIPNHRLTLKVGVPIMLLCNIDQAWGLCNGTILQVTELVPSDSRLPFKFCRRQFPICLCFAMTINKSQGQSLSKVGLFLPRPVFTHGQLYVAISRVTTKKGLKVLILDEDGKTCSTANNVVFPEILYNLKV